MRPRVPRLLHVLLCAPVAALVGATVTPATHVRASAGDVAPQRYTVAIDAGHGGSPDAAHPGRPYDAGAVGANGLLEKDVALEMARRVRTLLERDEVAVVMTRDSDTNIDISPRMEAAVAAGAQLFVSIHMNGHQDPAVSGSVVLYPNESNRAFAQVMSDAMARGLAPYGVRATGLQLRPELWQHASMPVCTLEPVFLTNPSEAELMTRDDVRDGLAHAIVAGIETQAPEVAARKAAIEAWRTAHPGVPLPTPAPRQVALSGRVIVVPPPGMGRPVGLASSHPSARRLPPPLELAALLAGAALVVLLRRRLFGLAGRAARAGVGLVARIEGVDPPVAAAGGPGGRRAVRAGERQARRRKLIERAQLARRGGLLEDAWQPRRPARATMASPRPPGPAAPRRRR